jgi:hypothetical protein
MNLPQNGSTPNSGDSAAELVVCADFVCFGTYRTLWSLAPMACSAVPISSPPE